MRQQLLPIAFPPAFEIPMLTLQQAETLSEEGEVWFRVAADDANLLEETSVEDAFGTPDEIAERLGFADAAELKTNLERHDSRYPELFWNEEGHFGAGVYYHGVCCCDDFGTLADYAMTRHWAKPGDFVWVFKGEYIGTCTDGDVVAPAEVVGIVSLTDFVKGYVADRQAKDASIDVLGIETALGLH